MSKKVLVIDNYDSFTYNLVQQVREITGQDITVWRNDAFTLEQVEAFDQIILSPGPGLPSEAGLMPEVVKTYADSKSILGICLGHQCIAEVFGGKLSNLDTVIHGKNMPSKVLKKDFYIFTDLPQEIETGRYHSWVVSKEGLPECIEILAEDADGNIMALHHKEHDIVGLQFHPESVLTPDGCKLMENWLKK